MGYLKEMIPGGIAPGANVTANDFNNLVRAVEEREKLLVEAAKWIDQWDDIQETWFNGKKYRFPAQSIGAVSGSGSPIDTMLFDGSGSGFGSGACISATTTKYRLQIDGQNVPVELVLVSSQTANLSECNPFGP